MLNSIKLAISSIFLLAHSPLSQSMVLNSNPQSPFIIQEATTMLDLSKILTPTLYRAVLDYRFPWNGTVDIEFASKFFFGGEPSVTHQVYSTTYRNALLPISTMDPSIPPNLTHHLPSSSSPSYPTSVLALLLLLDQAPRTLFFGPNVRYTNLHFDIIARTLLKELIISDTLPDSTDVWISQGYSFDDVMIRKIWMYVPLVHSEHIEDHDFVARKIEQMRVEVEEVYGVRDPARDTKEKDSKDLLLFAEMIRGELPSTSPQFFFWVYRLLECHRPIIAKFGEYPYRNNVLGREMTPEEMKYMEDTDNFAKEPLTQEQERIIKEQVRNGVWPGLDEKYVSR